MFAVAPDFNNSESYAEFLQRVSVKVGLQAEATRTLSRHLRGMEAARLRVLDGDGLVVCLDAFEDLAQCRASWARIFDFISLPANTSALLDMAVRHCPGRSEREAYQDHKNNATAAEKAGMVDLLHQLDRTRFHDEISGLAIKFGCGAQRQPKKKRRN